MPPRFSKEWAVAAVSISGSLRQERTSPCEASCPAGNNIQLLHTRLADGDADGALFNVIAKNPFPGVTGRVCPHPCEEKCNRCGYDEPVAIHSLERRAADAGRTPSLVPLPDTGKRVAVVGAGPAGLTAARFLRQAGHSVVVYESSPVMGGLMRHSIPDFRLPKDVVDRETGAVASLGVEVETNVRVGRDVALSDIIGSFDACVLAAGLWRERLLDVPGKEFLKPAVSWMKSTTLERTPLTGKRVAVLGGGGVAFDCAFTAKRLGAAEVFLASLESEEALHAPAEEIAQAKAEGIGLKTGYTVKAVEQAEGGLEIVARAISGFSFDETGALKIEGEAEACERFGCDLAVCASGLLPDLEVLSGVEVELTPKGLPKTDGFGMTSVPGLFAAGDLATGPSLVAAAIGDGRAVALSVHRFLAGIPKGDGLDAWVGDDGRLTLLVRPALAPRQVVAIEDIRRIEYHPHAPREVPQVRRGGPALAFAEIEGGLDAEAAAREAKRCMHCGHCTSCGSCVESCPGHILAMGDDGPYVAYPEECWHCGCCRIACTCGAVSYRFPISMMV